MALARFGACPPVYREIGNAKTRLLVSGTFACPRKGRRHVVLGVEKRCP